MVLKNISRFCILCFLLFSACSDKEYEDYQWNYFYLVNNTDDILYSKVYYPINGGNMTVTTTINPNDTIDLYKETIYMMGDRVIDTVIENTLIISEADKYFKGIAKLTIKDNKGTILFYGVDATAICGTENFILGEKIWESHYYYYWTIDSAYIADKSCDMTLEDM